MLHTATCTARKKERICLLLLIITYACCHKPSLQVLPVHPLVQVQLSGAEHVPPFWQTLVHMAVSNRRTKVHNYIQVSLYIVDSCDQIISHVHIISSPLHQMTKCIRLRGIRRNSGGCTCTHALRIVTITLSTLPCTRNYKASKQHPVLQLGPCVHATTIQ